MAGNTSDESRTAARHERDAVGEVLDHRGRCPIARRVLPTGANQGDKADILSPEGSEGIDAAVPPDDGGGRAGQVVELPVDPGNAPAPAGISIAA